MGSQKANETIQASLLEIVQMQDWAVHKLFICSKRAIVRKNLSPPFFLTYEQFANSRPGSLSTSSQADSLTINDVGVLVNLPTIYAWNEEEEYYLPPL
jgi:hypothetical protein